MAYMIELRRQCETQGCTKLATHEVRAYNEPHGRYCRAHAAHRVQELSTAEANNPGGFR
jgi:hypothetical protein